MRLPAISGWLWKIIFVLLVLAIAFSGLFWLSQSGVFAIEEIIVEGNQTVQTEEILQKTAPLLRGESLMQHSFADAAWAAESIPYVDSVEFERDFPHTIRILVREHRPLVYLKAADGKTFLLTADAVVLEDVGSPDSTWPVLATKEPCAVETGSRAGCVDVVTGVEFVANIPVSFHERIVEVVVDGGVVTFKTVSGATVRFGNLEDYALKFEVARQLIARTVKEGVPVSIDVSVPDRPVSR